MKNLNVLIANIIISRVKKFKNGVIEITLPNGCCKYLGNKSHKTRASINIKSYKFFYKYLVSGLEGIGRSYIQNEWTSPDLVTLLEVALENRGSFYKKNKLISIFRRINILLFNNNKNSIKESRKNIHYHYDLGNKFFSLWLDKTMTYSSAAFTKNNDTLEKAQLNKYKMLFKSANIQKNNKVLEIGCGWGGFAEFTAKNIDVNFTGITISDEQYHYAKKRIKNNKLDDKVKIKLCDYRNINSKFDNIVSIEMFEAIGIKYWNKYFSILKNSLKKNGCAAIQVITIDEKIYPEYIKNLDFIQKYIFPGGQLPSKTNVIESAIKNNLKIKESAILGKDYALTIKRWRYNFNMNWKNIEHIGFDLKFKRMWDYYLSYCEAGFRKGSINVRQFIIYNT